AGHAADQMGRRPPAELFRDLVPDRLGALAVERTEVDVDDPPSEAVGDLAAETVHLVVVAPHPGEAGAEDGRPQDLRGLQVFGNEDAGLEAVPDALGRDRVRQVPGRGATDRGHAELARLREGDGDDPVLERQRGEIDRVVLDVQLAYAEAGGEPLGAQEGREADLLAQDGVAVDRQELAVAPHRAAARGAGLPAEAPSESIVVVRDLERTEAALAT